MNEHRQRLVSIVTPVILLLVWELLVRVGLLNGAFFPAPSAIAETLWKLVATGELWVHLLASLRRLILGFLLGATPGLVLGVIGGLLPFVRAILNPLIAATYPIPKSSIAPLILLIFGLGEASSVVLVSIGVFYLVLVNTMAGVANIEKVYLDMGRNYGASHVKFFWTVAIPGALPMIWAGLKLGMGMGLILIAVAEMMGTKAGIGYLIWESWQTFSVERMYVGLLVISWLGFAITLLMDEAERKLIPWKG